MNLIETVRATRSILDRPTQRSVVLAAVAAVVIALFDMVAIALVLPLVTIATGGSDVSGVGALVSNLLGAAEPRAQVVTLAVTVVVLFIVKDLGAIGYTWWLTGFKVLKRVDLSTRLLSHFLGAPYTEISRRSSAEMLRTMNDAVIQFYGTTVFGLMTIVSNVANLATIAVALLLSALLPSLALALLFVVSGFVYLKIMKPRARAAGSVAAEAQSAAYRTAFAALGGIKETRLRGSGDFFVDGYRQAALRGAYASRTAGFISAVPRYLLEILFILVVGGLLVLGFGQGADVSGGVGLVALFVAAGLRALPAVTSLMGQIANLHFGSSFVGIVLSEVENERKWHSQAIEHVSPLAINSEVSVADVSFRYPGGLEPAVRNVSFVLPRGSSLAVVGGSGAGKTTLVDLLLGLHTPTEGMISVDGVNIQENLVAWQRSVGYVPQEVFLREASLAQNVAFDEADDKIDRDRLREALRLAQLQDVVDKLEYGVDTPIGERGSRLSGGQRQRIGIARAVYQQPQLLVLDEATSALDNETEHQVSQAVNEMRGDLTVVIVAHRLSTVRHVDTVVVMHEGQVEALGSFDEVRRSSPRFARMVQLGSLT